jgi:membrane-associated phospholipid phosphatase
VVSARLRLIRNPRNRLGLELPAAAARGARTKTLQSPRGASLLLGAASLFFGASALAAVPADDSAVPAATPAPPAAPALFSTQVLGDVGAWFTAPLHWDGRDWAWFGGAVLAVGLAHRYDSQVRTHFVGAGPSPGVNSEDTKDAIPTVAVLGATWGYALVLGDRDGYREGWAMMEAAALSGVTDYALKFAAGRQTPEQATDPNEWFRSGSSFPSLHSTAAFAVGTVLAESGNDDYRYLRRLLGYGLGVFTSYERLKHNAHWLSDTAAGAALGISSAHFLMDRRYGEHAESHLALVPIDGGAMLTCRFSFQ